MNQSVLVKDTTGNFNKWNIYSETTNTYKICADCDKRFITEIYKCKTDYDYIDGVLYSGEIRNPFTRFPANYGGKAEFREIWLDKVDE